MKKLLQQKKFFVHIHKHRNSRYLNMNRFSKFKKKKYPKKGQNKKPPPLIFNLNLDYC